jgi:hypothetical protein
MALALTATQSFCVDRTSSCGRINLNPHWQSAGCRDGSHGRTPDCRKSGVANRAGSLQLVSSVSGVERPQSIGPGFEVLLPVRSKLLTAA